MTAISKLPRRRYDAVIVGARCAGAATAMLLARSGLRVLVVDRAQYGTDTLSTHALMRPAVYQLSQWGLLDRLKATSTPAIRRTVFHYGEDEIDIPISVRDGVDALYAPRRTVLDALMVDAAREAGAEVRYGMTMVDVLRSGDRVTGVVVQDHPGSTHEIEANVVIGADGFHSAVAKRVGAKSYRVGRNASAVVYGYWSGLDIKANHWHYRPGVAAGVIPTNDGLTCVFAGAPGKRFLSEVRYNIKGGYRDVVSEAAPELGARLRRGTLVGTLRGCPGQRGFFRQPWGPGWALVGDSGYFRDPLTAHGISDAFRDADLLARAVLEGTPDAYAHYHGTRNDLSSRFFSITDELAGFEWELQRVKELHKEMSGLMNREIETLSAIATAAIEPSMQVGA